MLSEFDFELSPEDLELIEKQEMEFMAVTANAGILDNADTVIQHLQAKVDLLSTELEHIRREKLVREGEIDILRQKLNHLESERYETLKRHTSKLESLEQERQALITHLELEIETLRFESALQTNQLRMYSCGASSHRPLKDAGGQKFVEFSDTFGDLVPPPPGAKKTKAISNYVDVSCDVPLMADSCEVVPSCNKDEADPMKRFVDLLHVAIGHADAVFAKTEVQERDRELATKARRSIQATLSTTGNALLALDLEYDAARKSSKNIIVYYVGLIVELFVCHNLDVAKHLRRAEITYSVGEGIQLKLGRAIPKCCTLVPNLCNYFRQLPPGICPSLTHQHLRIFKHLLWRAEKIPDPILQLLSDGSFKRKLLGFVHFPDKSAPFYVRRNDIVFDLLQMLDLMAIDRRVPLLLVKQTGDSSILNAVNDILCHLVLGTAPHKPLLSIPRAFIQLLFQLCLKRKLPAHVVFEPLNLKLLARRLSQISCRDNGVLLDDMVKNDVIVFFQVLHLIFISERIPIVSTLSREFLSLWAAVRHFVEDPDIGQYLTDLKVLVLTECERIARGEYNLLGNLKANSL